MSFRPSVGVVGHSGTGLWRQVLAALKSPQVSDAQREELLALGAAELALVRAEERRSVAAADVQRTAFEEFSLLLGTRQARVALRERREARHGKRESA